MGGRAEKVRLVGSDGVEKLFQFAVPLRRSQMRVIGVEIGVGAGPQPASDAVADQRYLRDVDADSALAIDEIAKAAELLGRQFFGFPHGGHALNFDTRSRKLSAWAPSCSALAAISSAAAAFDSVVCETERIAVLTWVALAA